MHDTLWRISEDLLKEVLDINTLQIMVNKTDTDLRKIAPCLKILEEFIKINNISHTPMVTVGLWYAANNDFRQAFMWMEKALKFATDRVKKVSAKKGKDHISNKHIPQIKEYLKIIQERLKDNNP